MRLILLAASLMLSAPTFATGGGPPDNVNFCNANGAGDDIVCSEVGGATNNDFSITDNSNTVNSNNDSSVDNSVNNNDNSLTNFSNDYSVTNNDNSVDDSNTATGGAGGDSSSYNETDLDLVNRSTNRNTAEGGNSDVDNTNAEGQQQGQVGINLSETNVTDNSYDGGNTLIIGGGYGEYGECDYEEECEGGSGSGSGTLNSNAVATNGDNTNTATNEGNNTEVNVTIGEDGTPLTASSQTVGATTVEGDTVTVQGDTTTYEASIIPVGTAATVFSSVCTSGASGQRTTYGISLAVTSDTCTHLMMADAWMAMGDTEKAFKHVRTAGRHATFKGWFGYFRHAITLGIL